MRNNELELERIESFPAIEKKVEILDHGIQVTSFTNEHNHSFVSIESLDLAVEDVEGLKKIQDFATIQLQETFPFPPGKVCIVGLGNQWMTADALGPRVVQKLQQQYVFLQQEKVFLMQPGVRLQSGMETAELIESVIRDMQPAALLVIDALRASNQNRMCRFLQLSSGGIQPGSGLHYGNKELTEATLGIPVYSIGVPTVISTLDVTHQQMEYALQHFLNRVEHSKSSNPLASVAYWQAEEKELSSLSSLFGTWVELTKEERKQFIHENAGLMDRIVTATNIHEWIETWSDLLVHVIMDVLTPPKRT